MNWDRLNLSNPGALARQQRASADTKRGKRRKPIVEGAPPASAGSGEGNARDNTGSVVQVVPLNAAVPPVVKVKEERRKKRLLRNRVSAQQARERKKHLVNDVEERCNIMEKKNEELEDRMNTLIKENEELRQIVKGNMRASAGGNQSSGAGPNLSSRAGLSSHISRSRAEAARPVGNFGYGMGPGVPNLPKMIPYGDHDPGVYMQNNGGHIHS